MSSRSLVYLSYGGKAEQVAETKYSILSACRLLKPEDYIRIILYTDNPSNFDDLHVDIRPISSDELKAWRGAYGYAHRQKAEVVRDALRETQGPIVFVDSDTWYKRTPALIFNNVAPGCTVMHVKEGTLGRSAYAPNLALCEHFRKTEYTDLSGAAINAGPEIYVWNSGVIGMHPGDIHLVDEAIHFMDQVWPKFPYNPTLEQVAISYFLGTGTQVRPAAHVVFHYWSDRVRAPFHARVITALLETKTLPTNDRADKLHAIRPRLRGIDAVKYRVKWLVRLAGGSWPNSVPGSST